MEPSELKNLWVSTVRRIGRTDRYFVGKRWDPVFAQVCSWLNENRGINPLRFVEAQVNWCLRNRVQGALWPNLMQGEKAYLRYADEPTAEEITTDLQRHYETQARAFIALCDAVGIERALEDTLGGWSPLYLAYVRYSHGHQIPEALRAKAKQEAEAESLIDHVFPSEFIRSL